MVVVVVERGSVTVFSPPRCLVSSSYILVVNLGRQTPCQLWSEDAQEEEEEEADFV